MTNAYQMEFPAELMPPTREEIGKWREYLARHFPDTETVRQLHLIQQLDNAAAFAAQCRHEGIDAKSGVRLG